MSIFDSTYGLTEREQKALDRSWAKIFAEDVFPYIDEARFSVLYSEKASQDVFQKQALTNKNTCSIITISLLKDSLTAGSLSLIRLSGGSLFVQ